MPQINILKKSYVLNPLIFSPVISCGYFEVVEEYIFFIISLASFFFPSSFQNNYFRRNPLCFYNSIFISRSDTWFNSVQSLRRVWLFVTPWIRVHQASLSITNSRSPPKPMSIELVMPSNHLILCHPLLLLPSIFPSIRVFSNESALLIRWPKYWNLSFSNSPSSNTQDWSPLGWTGCISL